ncbi:MAG: glutamate racemase [Oscillospiraceae bacterium]|nr:glutamate racemase [Oscillospiraceae bacterium]
MWYDDSRQTRREARRVNNRPIAVFDSGLGGLSVLRELIRVLPEENFLYFGDSKNAPYGGKSTREIRDLTMMHAQALFARGSKALVVACNTATSAAINDLRAQYPDKIIIGIEPALKLAVTHFPAGRILVMATEATLRERKFAALMERFGQHCDICKCPCPGLVEFVERGELQGAAVEAALRKELKDCLARTPDAVVLGCTHYPFLRGAIRAVVGETPEILDGADGTAKETKRRLAEAGLLRSGSPGRVELTNSLPTPEIMRLSEQLLSAE